MNNTLFLYLEGPLQSWGERARWSIRDTAPEPTKSGVVGLLACACGWSDDGEVVALSKAIRLGVRCDRPGTVLRDYHTVVGGVMSAEGKIKKNATTGEPETVVSERFYLSDAAFLVAVQSEEVQLIARLTDAVQAPVWPFFFGRKSCIPSRPIYAGLGEYPDLETALRIFQPKSGVRIVLECDPSAVDAVRRRDEVTSRSLRIYQSRYTRTGVIRSADPEEVS